jgi:putative membrane protein
MRLMNAIVLACFKVHHPVAPARPESFLQDWPFEPLVLAVLGITAALYFAGTRRMTRPSRMESAAFVGGWLALAIALASPLHPLGEALFAAHMTQHELLMLVAAPLLVMGHPLVRLLWAMPAGLRPRVNAWRRNAAFGAFWAWLTMPAIAWLLHGLTLWVWHLPVLYQATLESDAVHALQHSCFLFSALLFWWTLMQGRHGRLGYGSAVANVFTTAVHSSALGALLTFSRQLWYPIYAGRTAAWGLTPIEDQQLGGLIMWVPAGAVFIVLGVALFVAWLGESERRVALGRTQQVLASGSPPTGARHG